MTGTKTDPQNENKCSEAAHVQELRNPEKILQKRKDSKTCNILVGNNK